MAQDEKGYKFGGWHFATIIVLLYALVVLVAMLTHQSPETMNMLLKEVPAAVGTAGLAVALFLLFLW